MKLFLYIFILLEIYATFVEVFVTEVFALAERNTETLILPYTVFNEGSGEERFKSEHQKDWLLSIKNNLIYNHANPESSTVLRLKEDAQSQEYIELVMDGTNKISVVVNIKETGYLPISSNGKDSWSSDKPLILLFSEANGGQISISNGERTLVDRLKVGKLSVETIEFYGSNSPRNTDVVSDGHIRLEITSGSPLANISPIFLLIFAGVAAAVLFSIRGLKRSKDAWYGRRGW